MSMPVTVKLNLGSEHLVVFDGGIESAYGKYALKGTAFAKARGPNGPGFIVTNGPVFLSVAEFLDLGATVAPGNVIAYGSADGEDIP